MLPSITPVLLAICINAATLRREPAARAAPASMGLMAVHRRVAVGSDDSIFLKVVYAAESNTPMPCVVLLSGADCAHESYMWLATRLAAAGCAVTLSTAVVPFGQSTCLLSVPFDLHALASLEEYKRGTSRAGIDAILAELNSLTNAVDGPLMGRLDLRRLAVGGHSSGGHIKLEGRDGGAARGEAGLFLPAWAWPALLHSKALRPTTRSLDWPGPARSPMTSEY